MARGESDERTEVVGRRVGAWLIDVVLVVAVLVVATALLGDQFTVDVLDEDPSIEWIDGDLAAFVSSTVFVLDTTDLIIAGGLTLLTALLVFVILPGRWGLSPGRWAATIRVVGPDDAPIGIGRALLRNAAWVVDGLPGIPVVGYATMQFTRHHRRVGDLLAGSRVVDARALRAGSGDDGAPAHLEAEPIDDDGPDGGDPDRQVGLGGEAASQETAARTSPESDAGGPAKTGEPVWDERWERYLLWHPKRRIWLTHDDEAGRWVPLEGDRQSL